MAGKKRTITFMDDPAFAIALLERQGKTASIVIDTEGTCIFFSRRAEQLFNIPRQQAMGANYFDLITLFTNDGKKILFEHRPGYRALHQKYYEQVTPFFCLYQKGTQRLQLALNVLQIRTGTKIIGAVLQFRRVERELNVGEMKNAFVSFAAHQLKTPSSIVKGFVELMLREGKQAYKPHQWDHLLSVYESNENLIRLSKSLLNLTRLEGGLIEPRIGSFEPLSIITQKIKSNRTLLDLKKMTVVANPATASRTLASDETFFAEIFDVLLTNAIKYSPPQSIITIDLKHDRNGVRVRVTDQGSGIPDSIINKMFSEQFAISPDNNSHGIGLLMAKKYIALLGGTISVTASSKGSVFTFTLPHHI